MINFRCKDTAADAVGTSGAWREVTSKDPAVPLAVVDVQPSNKGIFAHEPVVCGIFPQGVMSVDGSVCVRVAEVKFVRADADDRAVLIVPMLDHNRMTPFAIPIVVELMPVRDRGEERPRK